MASQTKAVATKEHLLRPRQEGLPKKIMSRHEKKILLVTTKKECRDQKVMLNGLEMSLLGNFRLRQRHKLETPIKVKTWNSRRDNKNELYS